MKPNIAITMGDPAGVGPELSLQVLGDATISKTCVPILFGDLSVLQAVEKETGLPPITPSLSIIRPDQLESLERFDAPTLIDVGAIESGDFQPGAVSQKTGAASYDYIRRAIDAALAGSVDGVVTGPIHKEAWQAAKIPYPGHTELFADRTGTEQFCMMMTAPRFSCSLVTTHIGYRDVPQQLTTESILKVTRLTHQALAQIYGRTPKLVMLGLNPHAGEGGLFGNREEETILEPAIRAARNEGIEIEGPLPPDTGFLPGRREATDGYICMYHDQGLIPFKAFNFDHGVNITLGLPMIRTSVDHGTALDIAWQGKADVSSFLSATTLAAQLV